VDSELVVTRFNAHVDPALHIWGWEVPVYLFLGGLTAGVMVLASLLAMRGHRSRWVRWLPLAAPVLISVGMLALLLDLENKERVYSFYLHLQVLSPMSWGSWILLVVYPATAALGLAGLTEDEVGALSGWAPLRATGLGRLVGWAHGQVVGWLHALRWTNVIVGIGLAVYTGILLSTLVARPAWNSAVLGPLFLASGLSTGAAFMMLFPLEHDEHRTLVEWDILAIAAELGLIVLYLIGLATSGLSGREGLALFVGGPYTASFWALVVFTGLGVPLVLEVVERRGGRRPYLLVPSLVLVGGLALRWVLVSAGQA